MSRLTSPILNEDVLIYIFHLNTYTAKTATNYFDRNGHVSPLHTLRRTSQVCRSWRQIILQSPTIWATTIDLWALDKGNKDWLEEVMKRTGDVKLSIYGPVIERPALEMFSSLVNENWDRLRRLDVAVYDDDWDWEPMLSEYNWLWDMFWTREAPNLEEFFIDVHTEHFFETHWGDDVQLFDGSAPLLRSVDCPLFPFDDSAPWIAQLVDVTLSPPLSITDALEVIANAPLLESLVVDIWNNKEPIIWNRTIHLPNLRQIEISSNIVASDIILYHITPRLDCALRLLITDVLQESDTFQSLSKLIFHYAEGYFTAHSPEKMAIRIYDFGIQALSEEAGDFDVPEFSIDLPSRYFRPSSDSSSRGALLFGQLFGLFKTVKRVTLMHSAVNIFCTLSDSATIFPDLVEVTIEMERWMVKQQLDGILPVLRVFLTRRMEAGHPVRRLRLPSNADLHFVKKSGFLRGLEGLRLLFEDRSWRSSRKME